MHRKAFLRLAIAIALAVGTIVVLFPAVLLAGKDALLSAAANLWMREVGVLLVCIGEIAQSGPMPNTGLHLVLAAGFAYYWPLGSRAVHHDA